MNEYARFEEIPSMALKDIKKTIRYGCMDGHTHECKHALMDEVKTVYPPTNTVYGVYYKIRNAVQ